MSDLTVQSRSNPGFAYSPWRHAYTVLMAVSILALICSGGLVTSNDAGLAVPDWPTSYGYNMFAFPLSRWLAPGGIRLEHSHRLIATGEGMLSIILAAWFWAAEPRRWVRNLGLPDPVRGDLAGDVRRPARGPAGGLDWRAARVAGAGVLRLGIVHRADAIALVAAARSGTAGRTTRRTFAPVANPAMWRPSRS